MPRSPLSHRPGRILALLAGLALVATMTSGLAAGQTAPTAHQSGTHAHPSAMQETSATSLDAAAFHDRMRKLWEDHVTWTRLAIVTFADGSAGFDATAARLMRNQKDIGDAIKPFYGKAAGHQLTALLEDHIGIAVELLQAAQSGDYAAFARAKRGWYANADDIAGFLTRANPHYWPRAAMRAAMRGHLDMTLAEASHELTGQYAASVADYEEVHHHILGMADVLSSGIVRAFPRRFH
ncbi:hypothetical protein ACS3YM_18445 [Nocardia sp. N13]|uniref:hypothetical protein n=1 Tax=Nocardioides sp. N13(2025) TaxID=3453405 RepID=UPI003F765757